MNPNESHILNRQYLEIEGMTPNECKNQGEKLEISYCFAKGLFGEMMMASTQMGICSIGLIEDKKSALVDLKKRLPNATYKQATNTWITGALRFFTSSEDEPCPLKLHLQGTDFQLKVWEALLKTPFGTLITYSDLAQTIHHPKAHRAVGTAVGKNPIFFLIPCHRVIRSNGELGNYHWGASLKTTIIEWEAAKKAQR